MDQESDQVSLTSSSDSTTELALDIAQTSKSIDSKNDCTGNNQEEENRSSDSDDETDFYDLSPVELAEALNEARSSESQGSIISGLEKLVLQQRLELAIELRRLQYSRTLTDSRNRLEQLFNSRNQPINNPTAINESTSTEPSQVPITIVPFRSETIQNEISALRNQQRVSSVLSTSREAIESTLTNLLRRRQPTTTTTEIQPQPINSNNTPQVAPTTNYFAIEQIAREQVLTDISNLVNQQLVSSILRSDFRSTLEDRILDRLSRSGTDGQRTRQLVQEATRLTPRVTPRSEITGASRAQFANAREVRELKDELSEMKNLLKLSLEMQMDMQRAFKQEISALISNTFVDSASARLVNTSRVCQEGHCVICTEKEVDSVFYQCGHMCTCYMCSVNLKQKNHNCPVCRAPINDILRVFKANLD